MKGHNMGSQITSAVSLTYAYTLSMCISVCVSPVLCVACVYLQSMCLDGCPSSLSPFHLFPPHVLSFLFPPHWLIVSLNQFDRIEAFVPQESSQEDYDEAETWGESPYPTDKNEEWEFYSSLLYLSIQSMLVNIATRSQVEKQMSRE